MNYNVPMCLLPLCHSLSHVYAPSALIHSSLNDPNAFLCDPVHIIDLVILLRLCSSSKNWGGLPSLENVPTPLPGDVPCQSPLLPQHLQYKELGLTLNYGPLPAVSISVQSLGHS